MLQTAGALGAGWYRDPADRHAARFHDGEGWTHQSQVGSGRLLKTRPRPRRARAAMTRSELNNRQALRRWTWLGQYVDEYL